MTTISFTITAEEKNRCADYEEFQTYITARVMHELIQQGFAERGSTVFPFEVNVSPRANVEQNNYTIFATFEAEQLTALGTCEAI